MVSRSSPMLAAMLSTPTGPPSNPVDHGFQQFAIHQIKPLWIHIKHFERCLRDGQVDVAGTFHLRKVAHAAQ